MRSGTGRRWPGGARPWLFPVLALALLFCTGADVVERDPLIEAVQRKLAEKGFDPGPIDGTTGSRTRGALKRFQRSSGLSETGRIDDATRKALGVELPAAPPDPEARKADAARAGPESGAGKRLPKTEAPRPEPAPPEAATEAPATGTPRPASKPEAATNGPETKTPSRPEPAPERAAGRWLSFEMLGWHPPQTGAEALARFDESNTSPEIKRGEGALVVPESKLVFVLETGERIPGFDCDPGAGRLSVEFLFSLNGPAIFTPAQGGGYCQMGFGIALEAGRTLEMRRAEWGDAAYPGGTVRITGRGLEYVRR